MRAITLVISFCLTVLTASDINPLADQQVPETGKSSPKPVFLYATVTRKKGVYVTGLDKSAFTLTSNKVAQDIAYFSEANEPASVALLVDVSNSMRAARQSWMRAAREGMATLVSSDPQNEYSLIAFSNQQTVVVDWSRDIRLISNALADDNSMGPRGYTVLYDACRTAVERLRSRSAEKRIIILITDGQDNLSVTSYAQLREMIKGSDVLVYSVGRIDIFDELGNYGREVLGELSKVSGGAAIFAATSAEAKTAFSDIQSELQHQYTIGFHPNTLDQKWHTIELSVAVASKDNPAKRDHVLVHAKPGYYSTAAR